MNQRLTSWRSMAALTRTVLSALLLASCASDGIPGPDNRILAAHHNAARYLMAMAGEELEPGSPMVAASFADINNLTMTSAFGRMASRNVMSAFVIEGYSFIEMLMPSSVYVEELRGEFLLSREVAAIGARLDATIALVGSYAVANDNVFVTTRLVRTADNVIVASYDYAVPYTRDMRMLLRPQR
jgi:TolB-like protein